MAFVETRLGRWFYEEHGAADGPTVVLLHGLFFDTRMWAHQTPALAALGRVIAFDGPGHGRSALPPPFTLEDQADALAEAFDVLGVDRAIVVGLSWGAMVALRFALAHPARVSALAVLGGSAEVESRLDVVAHRILVTVGRHLPLPAVVARRILLPMILSPHTLRSSPALVDELVRVMQSQPREGVARASQAVVARARRLTFAVSSIRVPSLVLCGEDDRTTPATHSRRLAASIPGAQLEIMSECGHMTALEQPRRVTDALSAFIKAVAPGRTSIDAVA